MKSYTVYTSDKNINDKLLFTELKVRIDDITIIKRVIKYFVQLS